jgi:hypothetical protein
MRQCCVIGGHKRSRSWSRYWFPKVVGLGHHTKPAKSISMPSVEEARQIAAMVQRCWAPQLFGCFGAIDGSVHRKERKGDANSQRRDYNGMDCVHAAKSFTVWTFDGRCRWAAVNDPGSSNDVGILQWTGFMQEHLEKCPPGLYICGDSIFPQSPNLLRLIKDDEIAQLPPRVGRHKTSILLSFLLLVTCHLSRENGAGPCQYNWRSHTSTSASMKQIESSSISRLLLSGASARRKAVGAFTTTQLGVLPCGNKKSGSTQE